MQKKGAPASVFVFFLKKEKKVRFEVNKISGSLRKKNGIKITTNL